MPNVLVVFQNAVDHQCLVNGKLTKKGCRVSLSGTPDNKLVIDFDSTYSPIPQQQSKCDYLYVDESNSMNHVVPLELKSGDVPSVSQVSKQLQAGANFCQSHLSTNFDVNFIPVLVSGTLHKSKRLKLRKHTITFNQRLFKIRWLKCGNKLIDVLNT